VANDNNIKNFTASDIERYHRGQLSAKEMHAMEKAALDDPFLADALEGYAVAGINVNADIAELKKRLAEKTEQAKVIPMQRGGSSFPWLRAAVMIVLIAGAGTLAYQFLFKADNKEKSIADAPAIEKSNTSEPAKSSQQADSNKSSVKETPADKKTNTDDQNTANSVGKQKQDVAIKPTVEYKSFKDTAATQPGETIVNAAPATTTPPKVTNERLEDKKTDDLAKQKANEVERKADVVAKNERDKLAALKKPAANNTDGVVAQNTNATSEVVVNGYATTNRRNDNNNYRNTNVFRGQVRDANNNVLPFANITNSRDNVGTYSDAQGNFTLVSTDTVLDVQVRSLGFQNNNVQLRNYVPDNRVVLQEDRSLSAKVLDTVKRNISSRARNNTMTFEEPEPEDGWDSYGSYVVNNLHIPETYDMKKGGETTDNTVEVSFEVNKNGEPVNIKVEKSLCAKCDKEAIRLIKEGPKWKRKAKKSKRTTVTVPFIKAD
jgi:CarboxypepD_reg-like domain/Gram-negative bacterial TonB protein C-terminal